MVYQDIFYEQFRVLGGRDTLQFEEHLHKVGLEGLLFAELLPMGRACYRLGHLFRRYPAKYFFGEPCLESLTGGGTFMWTITAIICRAAVVAFPWVMQETSIRSCMRELT